MLAGYGKNIINPPVGAELCGYGYYLERKNTGIMDNLYARCLYIEQDGKAYAAVSCDLIGFYGWIADKVRNEAAAMGIDSLILCATHTHTGPATAELIGIGEPCPEYLKALPGMILAAVKEAAANKAEVTAIETADTPIEPIGGNRAIGEGPHDNHVRGALLRRAGAPAIALVSYACHPVTLGPKDKVSPDYPGEVCACFEEQGMLPVFFTGICGDIDPLNNFIKWGSGTKEIIREYGERIYKGFMSGLVPAPSAFGYCSFDTELPVVPVTPDELADKAPDCGHPDVFKAWEKAMLEQQPLPDTEQITVRGMKLGDLIFATVPYECFTKVGDILRTAYPKAFIAGCADKLSGYLPSEEDWDKGYAVVGSVFFYLRTFFAKGAAERLGEAIRDNIPEKLR